MEPVVEQDGNDEVGETHAREAEPRQRSKRPESHLKLAFRFFCILHREGKTDGRDNEADACEYS